MVLLAERKGLQFWQLEVRIGVSPRLNLALTYVHGL